MKPVRILVLGSKSVGKSAIAVRFLTKRFIGDYQNNCDILYRQFINFGDCAISIEMLDYSRHDEEEKTIELEDLKEIVIWAQAYIVVYSICDAISFERAQFYFNSIRKIRGFTSFRLPMLLLGNKRDLEAGRKVNLDLGRKLAFDCKGRFFEVSAAESYVGINLALSGLVKETKLLYEQLTGTTMSYHLSNTSIKKLSLNSVTRAFGAVFGGKSPSTSGSQQYYTVIRDSRRLNNGRGSANKSERVRDKARRSNSTGQNGSGHFLFSCKQKKDLLLDNSQKRFSPIVS